MDMTLAEALTKADAYDEGAMKEYQAGQLINPYLPDYIEHPDHPERIAERQEAYRLGASQENDRTAELQRLKNQVILAAAEVSAQHVVAEQEKDPSRLQLIKLDRSKLIAMFAALKALRTYMEVER